MRFILAALLGFAAPCLAESPASILSAGGVSAKLAGGELREIRLDGAEIANRISFEVRDAKGQRVAAKLEPPDLDADSESFSVKLKADCVSDDFSLSWKAVLKGTETGELSISFEATAYRDLPSAQASVSILLSAESVQRSEARFEHSDGTVSAFSMGSEIRETPIAEGVRKMQLSIVGGEIKVEGNAFTVSDRRGSGDSTYVLDAPLPFIAPTKAGDSASVSLRITTLGFKAVQQINEGSAKVRLGGEMEGVILPALGSASKLSSSPEAAGSVEFSACLEQAKTGVSVLPPLRFSPDKFRSDSAAIFENLGALAEQLRELHKRAAAIDVAPISFAHPDFTKPARTEAWFIAALKVLAEEHTASAMFELEPPVTLEKEISALSGSKLIQATVSGSNAVDALAVGDHGTKRLWVVNVTDDIQEFEIEGMKPQPALQAWEVRQFRLPGNFVSPRAAAASAAD